MLTLRDLGAAAITLLGLYFASRVVSLYAALMITPYLLSPRAFSSTDPLLAASISSAIGSLAVALVALMGARRMAARLFPATAVPLGGSAADVLRVGIVLLGLWIAADGAIAIVRAAAALVYYSQQQVPGPSLERSWPQVVANLAAVAAGLTLTLSARRLATRLDAR